MPRRPRSPFSEWRLAEDRRQEQLQRREHRHDVRAGRRIPELRLEHADELPDEAAFRVLINSRLRRGPSARDSGPFRFQRR